MRRIFVFLALAGISFLIAKTFTASAGIPGAGDRLSLSVTNKYGDVLVNPTVAQILRDGLILQSGTIEMKVKFADLPPSVSRKYQSMAGGIIKKEEEEGAANAAYFAHTRQVQTAERRQLAMQTAREQELARERPVTKATGVVRRIRIVIPNQNWKLTIADLGFGQWRREESNGKIALHGLPGPGGFNIGIFIESSVNNLPGNDAAYNYFWLNMGHDSLIDAQSVRVEKRDRFIKVSYTARGEPNFNYFFSYNGHWVDLHLAKPALGPGDEGLIGDFDKSLSYGE